jgi:hypothetical protein
LLIFFDTVSGTVLWHKFIQSQPKENYLESLNSLLEKGFEILSVKIDGRRGITQIFNKWQV